MKTGLIGLCAASLLGGAAQAGPVVVVAEPVPTKAVSFADLNLASLRDQSILKNRIRTAAGVVCTIPGDYGLYTSTGVQNCYRGALNDGLRQMDALLSGGSIAAATAATALTISRH